MATRSQLPWADTEEAKKYEVTDKFDIKKIVDASGPPVNNHHNVKWVGEKTPRRSAGATRTRATSGRSRGSRRHTSQA